MKVINNSKDLDNLLKDPLKTIVIRVKTLKNFWPRCILTGVYIDGRVNFVILEDDNIEMTLEWDHCIIYYDEGDQ